MGREQKKHEEAIEVEVGSSVAGAERNSKIQSRQGGSGQIHDLLIRTLLVWDGAAGHVGFERIELTERLSEHYPSRCRRE